MLIVLTIHNTSLPAYYLFLISYNLFPTTAHHILYMPMFKGYASCCAAKGQKWIRKVLLDMYKPTANMFPGDEDNGEMGAWVSSGRLEGREVLRFLRPACVCVLRVFFPEL